MCAKCEKMILSREELIRKLLSIGASDNGEEHVSKAWALLQYIDDSEITCAFEGGKVESEKFSLM